MEKVNWIKFKKNANSVNNNYRRGLYEVMIGDRPLRVVADEIFQTAIVSWRDRSIPKEFRQVCLKAMANSFEIGEYYLDLSDEKKNFFEGICREFLSLDFDQLTEDEKTERLKAQVISTITGVKDFPPLEEFSNEEFVSIVNEVLLLCLCGINVLYLRHGPISYKDGLGLVLKLQNIISWIAHIKANVVNGPKGRMPAERHNLGLFALAKFFEGRFCFGLGNFRQAEKAYRVSIGKYVEKVLNLVDEPGDVAAESRTLALRRSNLVEVIGLVNLYLVESRIDEAQLILERIEPLLAKGTDRLIQAYCKLLHASVLRAKFSSDLGRLRDIERDVRICRDLFVEVVGNSHYVHKAGLELSLIHFYQAKHPKSPPAEKPQKLASSIELLTEAINFGEATTDADVEQSEVTFRNRRMLVEALTIRCHIHRNLAHSGDDGFSRSLDKAEEDGHRARRLAGQLRQLEADANIALGVVFRDRFDFLAEKGDLDRGEIRSKLEAYKEQARECFLNALHVNRVDNNIRLAAICYVRLAELEMLHQTNHLRARFFYQQFQEIAPFVGHRYVLEFGEGVAKRLGDRQEFDFFVDPSESLNFAFWAARLKEFLIRQTVVLTAMENKGKIPDRDKKGKSRGNSKESLLAKNLIERTGIRPNDAYVESARRLNDFIQWCDIVESPTSQPVNLEVD